MSRPSLREIRQWAVSGLSDDTLDDLGGYAPRQLLLEIIDGAIERAEDTRVWLLVDRHGDAELDAIENMRRVLEDLPLDARTRCLDYIISRVTSEPDLSQP